MNNKNSTLNKNEDLLVYTCLKLFAGFYPHFYLLESSLKNRLYQQLKIKLGEDWFTKQLARPDPLFEEERNNILRRKPKNFVLTDHGLLAESGLGFWVEFFNRRLYKETRGTPIGIFKNRPSTIKRKDIYQKLDIAKEFRNQIFHSRLPVLVNSSGIPTLEQLSKQATNLEDILNWLGELPGLMVTTKPILNNIYNLKKKLEQRNG